MKKTAVAPSNIALIKYWGKKDESLRIPTNGSISVNLSNLLTTTTVEFSEKYKNDEIIVDGRKEKTGVERVAMHLDRIRKKANMKLKAKVVSQNNFPSRTGLSSSASGFAALTVAAAAAAGLKLSEKDLSILARLGSGSSCRSIPDGFVEWFAGSSNESSYAKSIFRPDYWDICDVVVVVDTKAKYVSTSAGQKITNTSPFYKVRLSNIKRKIFLIKKFIQEKNFDKFGELVESEALELHSIMLTSRPPLIYFRPETIKLMGLVRKWRQSGLPVYFTLNTGHNIHLLCEEKNHKKLLAHLRDFKEARQIIVNRPYPGATLINNNLF